MTPASVKPNARPHTSKNPVHLYDDAISLLNLPLHIRMKGLHNPLFVPLSSSNHPPVGYFGNGRLHAPRYPSCNFCTSSDVDCECNIDDCVTSDSSGVTGPFETYTRTRNKFYAALANDCRTTLSFTSSSFPLSSLKSFKNFVHDGPISLPWYLTNFQSGSTPSCSGLVAELVDQPASVDESAFEDESRLVV